MYAEAYLLCLTFPVALAFCTMLLYRAWPTNTELSMQNFLRVQVILGHKRHIILYVYTLRLNCWTCTLIANYLVVFFNTIMLSLSHTLNEKLKIKGACGWENIHWDCFVITMHFLFKKRQHCYRIKLICKTAKSAKLIVCEVAPGIITCSAFWL